MTQAKASSQRRYVVCTCMTLGAFILSTLLFFMAQTTHVSHAASTSYNWKQLKIGGGGYVTGIVVHPTVQGLVYARTDVGGVYKLGPNDTWQQLLTTSAVPSLVGNDYNVESIAVSKSNAQTLYVAAGDNLSSPTGRILKSTNQGQSFTDNGQRWTMGGNEDYRQGGERLAVDPNNDNVVYFGSRTQGLWVTTNAGANWTQISTSAVPVGSTPAGNQFVVFDPTSGTTNGKTNRIYVGVAGSGVYRSDDAGATWRNAISSTMVPYNASVASNGTLYVSFASGSSAGMVQRYSPSTNTATIITPTSTNGNYSISRFLVTVDPTNAQRVIVGGLTVANGNLWRTLDGGSTWTSLSSTLSSPTIPWILKTDDSNSLYSSGLLFDPFVSDKLWFAEGSQLWYSSNNTGSSVTWNNYSKGIEETVSGDVVTPPGGATVTNIFDRQGFYHSNVDSYPSQPLIDNQFWGGTNLDYSGGTPGTLVTVEVANNQQGQASGRGASSTDGGKTWHVFGSTPPYYSGGNIAISATNTNNLIWLPSNNYSYFGQGHPPYYSLDGGTTWNQSSGITDTVDTHWLFWWSGKRALASDKVNGSFYMITFAPTGSTGTGTFYASTNGGQSFAPAPYSPPCTQDDNCHVWGALRAAPGFAGHVWSSAGSDGLWYTTNAGQSAWTKVSAVQEARTFGFGKVLPGYSYPAIYLYGRANGDSSLGIYRSADQGATWTLLTTAPLGLYDGVNVVNGDMNLAGRVYVGFSGNGFAYADDQSLIQNATYTFTNRNSNLVLDDTNYGGAGTQLEQWSSYGNTNQQWTVTGVGGGYYKIICNANGLAVDVSGASTTQGAAVVLEPYTGSDSQLWQFVPTDSGYYQVSNKHSGMSLNISGASTNTGGLVVQWPYSSYETNAQWLLQSVNVNPIQNGTYKFTNRNSSLVLDDTGWGGAGTQLEQWTSYGNTNQQWTVTAVGGGYYKIICNANGLAVDVAGASTTQGAAVVLEPYTGSDSQLWQFVPTDSGYYQVSNKHSGMALNVYGASTSPGGLVVQWPYSSVDTNAQWLLQ